MATDGKKVPAKEWFPSLPGLHQLSKAEVLEDLDYIQSNAPAEAKAAAAAAAEKTRAALKRKAGKDTRSSAK